MQGTIPVFLVNRPIISQGSLLNALDILYQKKAKVNPKIKKERGKGYISEGI